MVICISSEDKVAINKPFHVGDCPYFLIFWNTTISILDESERGEADDEYAGEPAK